MPVYIVRCASARIPEVWAGRSKGVHKNKTTRPWDQRASTLNTLENDRCKQVQTFILGLEHTKQRRLSEQSAMRTGWYGWLDYSLDLAKGALNSRSKARGRSTAVFAIPISPGFRIRIDLMRIRIPDLGSGSRVWWSEIEKNLQLEIWFLFFWSKIAIYLSLCLHKGCPSYRRSLQPSKVNIQHFKRWKCCPFFYFLGAFFTSWIRIRNLYADPDPDPTAQINADPCRLIVHALLTICIL